MSIPGGVDTKGLEELRRHFAGTLLRPGIDGYEEGRRVWNADIDRRPALIARCANAADVQAALRFARDRGSPVSVRGGGHGVAGWAVCDGGVMLDLSGMRRVTLDSARGRVRADAGVVLGELDATTQAAGLAVPAGIVTHTGIAGLTLGGGIGWLMRAHGLTSDNLVGADVVLPDGRVVRADDEHDPELLWGLRGGGGNFGVVTSFEYRVHPMGPEVVAGAVFYRGEDAADVLHAYQAAAATAPDGLTTIVNLRHAAPLPFLPPELHGRPVAVVAMCHAGGDRRRAERDMAPFRSLARPLVDVVMPKPFAEHQSMFDASVPWGWSYYWKSRYLGPLSEPAIDTLVDHAWAHDSPRSYLIMFHMGGAIRRLTDDDSAFTGRSAEYALNINAVWTDPSDRAAQVAWARATFAATEPFEHGVYVNFLGDEGQERVREAYGEEKFARLRVLKGRYDPDNVLRLNQNIAP
jgi:FAD/FMN-containing dehydrogenase